MNNIETKTFAEWVDIKQIEVWGSEDWFDDVAFTVSDLPPTSQQHAGYYYE